MKCEDVMKSYVECVSEQDSVVTAAKRMRDEKIGFLPVCNASKEVQGTVTDRDIVLRLVAEDLPSSTPVGQVMSRQIVACRPTDSLRHAEQLMAQHQKSRILCTDETGKLAGVISLSDIAQQDTGHAARVLRDLTLREARA